MLENRSNTPANYQNSLGSSFYVRRQWNVSRGGDYIEDRSSSIRENQVHILKRFLNLIKFVYVPAIKDGNTFERLLSEIYLTISNRAEFSDAVKEFTQNVQKNTSGLFEGLPPEVALETRISAPTRFNELFQTLDFETSIDPDVEAKSLIMQRGDGIKARHIPELLNFISKNDNFSYHIWGFEEPENSLDFLAAEAEALRFARIAKQSDVQVFVTTHSPAFYNLDRGVASKFYLRQGEAGADIVQGKQLIKFDPVQAMSEGFYLPAVAQKLEELASEAATASIYREEFEKLQTRIQTIEMPIILTEGKSDAIILNTAWEKLKEGTECPYKILSCDTSVDGSGGGSGGASKLGECLKTVRADNPSIVVGLFDRDDAGIAAFKLDKNFNNTDLISDFKVNKHKKAGALLLHVPLFRTVCAEHHNLPIEYLFSDNALETKIKGKGLEFERMKFGRTIGSKKMIWKFRDLMKF
jgi:hypothetical protein